MILFQIILFIAIGFLLLSIILLCFKKRRTDKYGIICLVVGGILEFIGIWGMSINSKTEPTALDVYRGKTTLEITYRDSVAVDSTVVYKVKK